ncbi:MAG: pirin family protein [Phycisphaeraceae bacterium]
MIIHRPAQERGRTQLDWLDSRHSFAFGSYHDPEWMGFGPLRVINDDHIKPGAGFGMHRHRDMEIISWVLQGRLAHRDSLDNHGIIEPGMAQVMTARRGIKHSEFNPSTDQPVHLLQIWIQPRQSDLEATYADRRFEPSTWRDRLGVIASPDGREDSLRIEQDAYVYVAELLAGQSVEHAFAAGRLGWVQVARGEVALNDTQTLAEGDGAGLRDEAKVQLRNTGSGAAEIVLFDLPPDDRHN